MARRLRRHRHSGAVRQLPSGRWQARLQDADGAYVSLGAFRSRAEADKALTLAVADQTRGSWVDPRSGRTTLERYADSWLADRAGLRPRTRELYAGQLRNHILPALGGLELGRITPAQVRQWHAQLSSSDVIGSVTTAKCYRLLRTILATAVEDELISRNPCVLQGAGAERSPERPVATVQQVRLIADAVEPRYRMLVLVATYTTLRLGELAALTRRRVDLENKTIEVVAAASEMANGTRIIGPPKSAAGRRTVSIPDAIVPSLRDHLERFSAPGEDGLVFCGPKGAPLRRSNWNVRWRRATAELGMEYLRFHDLRHTGNTMAASTGASTKELMARMGHASPRAALIYQHATRERESAIAAALSAMIDAESA
jgi:integrase